MLRGKWGLNSLLGDSNQKNRTDHRHHAIDAAVVATVDVALIKKVQTAAGRAEQLDIDRLFVDLETPWPSFRDELGTGLRGIVVSHKPDHGWQAKLHNDTAYGLATRRADGSAEGVSRKPVASIKATEISAIRDEKARALLNHYIQAALNAGKTEADGRSEFEMATGTRRLRLLTSLGAPIPLRDRSGKTYKVVKGDSNYCYEIYETDKGKWSGKVVSSFEAATLRGSPISIPAGAKRVMRLHQNDLVWIPDKPRNQVMRVVKFSEGSIVLAAHFEGGNMKARDADKADPFKYLGRSPEGLRKMGAKLATVSPAGLVHAHDTSSP